MAYTVSATTKGGRNGRAILDNGGLALAMGLHGLDGQDARVTCSVAMDKDEISFGFKAELKVTIPGADKAKVQALVEDAHRICPYSRATRNNVPVTLTVV
jgi:osmotically inducible protein OsmC